MLGSRTQHRGARHPPQPRNRDLQVCWANVGKSLPYHITILQTAFTEMVDVVCLQEPYTHPGTKTQNHPGYECYTPVDSWDSTDPDQREAERPRVMTYVRKGAGLRVQQRRPIHCRDLLWTDVNSYSILNVYRQKDDLNIIDYVTHLAPPPRCLVGGDLNVRHEMFEPGAASRYQGAELAQWASNSNMDYIGTPGEPTHRAGHVLDLTFSNIPFTYSTVRPDMHSGSDHETQVTRIPGRGIVVYEQHNYRIPDKDLSKFVGLIQNGIAQLPAQHALTSTQQIDDHAEAIAEIFSSSIQTAGKPDRGGGNPAPWWTPDCQDTYRAHLEDRNLHLQGGPTFATRVFLSTVRRAKRDYWKHIINGVKDSESLFKVVSWHKLSPRLKAPPLKVNGTTIEDTLGKAEALRAEVLDRFSANDDLPYDPLTDWDGSGRLDWQQTVSIEEVERNTIGVSSTSPGTDQVTVRLLKACWDFVKHAIHQLFSACLLLNYFPQSWKLAEVVMLPKAGKKDKTSVRSWRPIALLSCISKGLERIVARRIAWTALTAGVLSPQHGGALPKRSAMDLVAAFTHDVETAFIAQKSVTMITMDVQGAFDALLVRRLLDRMTAQGWPLPLLKLVRSFLSNRKVRVRLEQATTPFYEVKCGTPQGSPLSPVLYTLYLAELLSQDTTHRFGYADDICLYRATDSLEENTRLLAADVQSIISWGTENKILFAPEKLEMIHITKKHNRILAPQCVVNNELTIYPITTAPNKEQPALRWLGVWFDRRLTFRRHVFERAAKARNVAQHIRGLANTTDGPPASALRKAVIACVLPSALYGTEAWYAGRTKPRGSHGPVKIVSTQVGWHVDIIESALTLAARGVLPVWRTTPTITLFRDAGLPSAMAALEEAKLRFALRLQTTDAQHPLTHRMKPLFFTRGRDIMVEQRQKSKVQTLGQLLPAVPRPILRPPHFSIDCRINPTGGLDKTKASAAFKAWWALLPPEDVTIFSDGSEQHIDGSRHVAYGYAIYQNRKQIGTGHGAINPVSHVFDGEAIGVWKGLQHTIRLPANVRHRRLWLCIDSTSVIWCLRGDAAVSSQWAFHLCQDAMQTHDIRIRWAPGHTGIEGNEAADKLADLGTHLPYDTGHASEPTASGIKSIFRGLRKEAQEAWWNKHNATLSKHYEKWNLDYKVKLPPELDLPRPVLHRYLAIRSGHGDFSWYHKKFAHSDAKLTCSCGHAKDPRHLVRCQKTIRLFGQWPQKPPTPPSTRAEATAYLTSLMAAPKDFDQFLKITKFYSKICT
jgi:ribonuclease HI